MAHQSTSLENDVRAVYISSCEYLRMLFSYSLSRRVYNSCWVPTNNHRPGIELAIMENHPIWFKPWWISNHFLTGMIIRFSETYPLVFFWVGYGQSHFLRGKTSIHGAFSCIFHTRFHTYVKSSEAGGFCKTQTQSSIHHVHPYVCSYRIGWGLLSRTVSTLSPEWGATQIGETNKPRRLHEPIDVHPGPKE